MSLVEFREEGVRKRRPLRRTKNFLGVIKSVPDMRNLMDKLHFNFPVYVRFHPDSLRNERQVTKLDDIFGLLSEAKKINGLGDEGKRLFIYRLETMVPRRGIRSA